MGCLECADGDQERNSPRPAATEQLRERERHVKTARACPQRVQNAVHMEVKFKFSSIQSYLHSVTNN